MNPPEIKKNIKKEIFKKLGAVDGVFSITIVGSFVNDEGLKGISDIDTIVVCERLNNEIFNNCHDVVRSIDLNKCGLKGFRLKINSTFGPLKFDKPNLAVIHLMIYDIKAHIKHVISSPFTCFDWERSTILSGVKLKNIFPVGVLQFRDFLKVRRSLENYINDIDNDVISFREYSFSENRVFEVKKNKQLDKKHRGEYSYHIIRNLICNYLKLCNRNNISYSKNDIISEINRIMPNDGDLHAERFKIIYKIKKNRSSDYPNETLDWAKSFLIDFQEGIKREWEHATSIHFIRHFKTSLNDKSYLGQGRDPSIRKKNKNINIKKSISKLFSSPLKRCIESAEYIFNNNKILMDDRLMEFNYGRAEGLSYEQLIKEYPEMFNAWENGEDIKFPEGENTKDVHNRLKSFLEHLSKNIDSNISENIYVVTHNGIMRCLIGEILGLHIKEWHRLIIPHAKPLEFLCWQNKLFPNFSRKLWYDILQNIRYI